jgi:hypothetical protein
MHQIKHLIVGPETGGLDPIGRQSTGCAATTLVKRSNEALRRLDSIALFISHEHPPDRVSFAGI